jgi:hypothetical protein
MKLAIILSMLIIPFSLAAQKKGRLKETKLVISTHKDTLFMGCFNKVEVLTDKDPIRITVTCKGCTIRKVEDKLIFEVVPPQEKPGTEILIEAYWYNGKEKVAIASRKAKIMMPLKGMKTIPTYHWKKN